MHLVVDQSVVVGLDLHDPYRRQVGQGHLAVGIRAPGGGSGSGQRRRHGTLDWPAAGILDLQPDRPRETCLLHGERRQRPGVQPRDFDHFGDLGTGRVEILCG